MPVMNQRSRRSILTIWQQYNFTLESPLLILVLWIGSSNRYELQGVVMWGSCSLAHPNWSSLLGDAGDAVRCMAARPSAAHHIMNHIWPSIAILSSAAFIVHQTFAQRSNGRLLLPAHRKKPDIILILSFITMFWEYSFHWKFFLVLELVIASCDNHCTRQRSPRSWNRLLFYLCR